MSGRRWWVVAAAAGALLVLAVTLVGSFVTTRRHHHGDWHIGTPGVADVQVGVLLTGTALDRDVHSAAVLAVKEHIISRAGPVGLSVLEVVSDGTSEGVVQAFRRAWHQGVRLFLVEGDERQLRALCREVEAAGTEALMVAPLTHLAASQCPALVALAPPPAALITTEVNKLVQAGVTRVVPVVTAATQPHLQPLNAAAQGQGLTVAPAVHLGHNYSVAQLKSALAAWPEAGVWVSAGRDLPAVLTAVGGALHGRPVVVHTHPRHRATLLQQPAARAAAETAAVCTVAWAGPTRTDNSVRRKVVSALASQHPLVSVLAYDATLTLLGALSSSNGNNSLDITQIKWKLHNNTADSGEGMQGWALQLRLVANHLLGRVVLQELPWLFEGAVHVEGGEGGAWQVTQQYQPPALLVTSAEVIELVNHTSCNTTSQFRVQTHDPLSHRPVAATWRSSLVPPVLLLPNGSPRGFSVWVRCHDDAVPGLEIGCQGAGAHNDTLRCISASFLQGRGNRRVVRSIHTHHRLPIGQRFSPVKRKTESVSTFNYLKALIKHEDVTALIPQVGGCLGATAGCSLCYIYIIKNNVNVNPGVCFGACAVAVGGSCTTLMSRGIQYYIVTSETVICTELFRQGRLSVASYMADASFGATLGRTNALALRGYQLLAAPLVSAMQVSPALSEIVARAAQPWIQHMEYVEGVRDMDSEVGCLIMQLGLPLCTTVALVVQNLHLISLTAAITLLCHQSRLWKYILVT